MANFTANETEFSFLQEALLTFLHIQRADMVLRYTNIHAGVGFLQGNIVKAV